LSIDQAEAFSFNRNAIWAAADFGHGDISGCEEAAGPLGFGGFFSYPPRSANLPIIKKSQVYGLLSIPTSIPALKYLRRRHPSPTIPRYAIG
jgi:hypothetical protein